MQLHRQTLALSTGLLAGICLLATAHAEVRVFTDSSGRTLRGELVAVNADFVTIKREDGQTFTLKASNFSTADMAYFREHGLKLPASSPSVTSPSASPPAKDPKEGKESGVEGPFEIRNVRKVSKSIAKTESGWKDGAACIGMDVRITVEMVGKPYARAYFYDKAGKLMYKANAPSMVSDDGSKYFATPEVYYPKKWESVFFVLGEKVEGKGPRWARVVTVFGNKDRAVAHVFPSGNPSDFTFDEKHLIAP